MEIFVSAATSAGLNDVLEIPTLYLTRVNKAWDLLTLTLVA